MRFITSSVVPARLYKLYVFLEILEKKPGNKTLLKVNLPFAFYSILLVVFDRTHCMSGYLFLS